MYGLIKDSASDMKVKVSVFRFWFKFSVDFSRLRSLDQIQENGSCDSEMVVDAPA